MNTKEKADALVDKHQQATMSFLNERQKLINATKNASISVEHTIEVLNGLVTNEFNPPLSQTIQEQTELLTELKSRI